ncbi:MULTISPECIES: hypothetical protein [unclassified Moraxella]
MKSICYIFILLSLNACTTVHNQWYDSPIPVAVTLSDANHVQYSP